MTPPPPADGMPSTRRTNVSLGDPNLAFVVTLVEALGVDPAGGG
jgi:hypothetical protein